MRRSHCVALIALALLLTGVSACQSGSYPPVDWAPQCAGTSVDKHAASEQAVGLLQDALAHDHGSGISAVVIQDGQVVWRRAIGKANDDQQLTPATQMRIGSLSKPLTAAAIARLVERGDVQLDAPVQRYVPEFAHADTTVEQLVYHTSGMRQYDFSSYSDSNNTTNYPNLTEGFERHLAEPLEHVSGSTFQYSSIGYNMLGIVIERAYGAPYGEALQDLVTEPMGLPQTRTDDPSAKLPCRADFSTVLFGRFRVGTIWRDNSDLYPSGGLLSTPNELAHFAHTVLASDFFDEGQKARFSVLPDLPDGSQAPYAFGWQVEHADDGQIVWIGHGGTINGAYASVRYYPCSRMIVSGIANYNFGFTGKRPRFFEAIREQIPALFARKSCTT